MRRRPSLELFLTPPILFPGDVADARIKMVSRSDTPCDRVEVDLVGIERRYAHGSGTTESPTSYHQRDVVRLRATFDGFLLSEGEHERRARFDIPVDAPPSYDSRTTSIRYEITVRVVIPWWPDRVATYRIPIAVRPSVGASPRAATRYTSARAPKGKELFIEASLARDDLAIGTKVEGAVSFANVAHHRIRRVKAALVELETPHVRSDTGTAETLRSTWNLREGKPGEAEELRFALRIPDQHWPDFTTPFISVSHQLRVIAEIAFGSDIHIAIPIRLHRPRLDVAEVHATPALLGRGKRKSNWARVASEFASVARVVRLDEETDEILLDRDGRSIHLLAEHRGDDGPFLVAEVEWPSLGLGLKVSERSWSDFGRRKGVVALDQRFAVEVRDPDQARELFDSGTIKALFAFQSVGLDDTHAAAASPGSSHAAGALKEMLARAVALSDIMATAGARISPPKGLAPCVDAYRLFADRYGGRLVPGDFSVQGMTIDGVSLSLAHVFEGAVATSSRVTVDASIQGKQIAGIAEQVKKIESSAEVSERGVRVDLPLLLEPRSIEPLLEGLAAAVRSLIGEPKQRGPYR